MSLTFDMNSPQDALNDLKGKVECFHLDRLNQDLAMDCAIAAWSLCDWVFRHDGKRLGFAKLLEIQEHAKDECIELGLLQDLANARKHGGDVTKYQPQLERAFLHKGSFSQSFSRSFNISCLYLVHDGGQKFFMGDVLDKALRYWEGFFHDRLSKRN